VRISADLASGGNVLDYQVSPDGQRVVYRADQAVDGLYELFSASVWSGRGQAKLSRPLVPGGNVGSYRISADSRTVAFTAQRLVITPSDPGHPGGNDPPLTLLRAPIRGEEKASEIAGPFHGNGTVRDFQISANGTVVYRADQDEQDAIELYAAAGVPRPTGPLVFKR
jgi:dipeptidyl aminopeptidase/acylaminoacyl peptidase